MVFFFIFPTPINRKNYGFARRKQMFWIVLDPPFPPDKSMRAVFFVGGGGRGLSPKLNMLGRPHPLFFVRGGGDPHFKYGGSDSLLLLF